MHDALAEDYAFAFPSKWRVWLSSTLLDRSRSMVSLGAPSGTEDAWLILAQYKFAYGSALSSTHEPPIAVDAFPFSADHARVFPLLIVASRISHRGAQRMVEAADTVEAALPRASPSPLNCEEARWVRALIRGDRTIDVAIANGRSERSLYRDLDRIWKRIGAASRSEGIAICAREGWVD